MIGVLQGRGACKSRLRDAGVPRGRRGCCRPRLRWHSESRLTSIRYCGSSACMTSLGVSANNPVAGAFCPAGGLPAWRVPGRKPEPVCSSSVFVLYVNRNHCRSVIALSSCARQWHTGWVMRNSNLIISGYALAGPAPAALRRAAPLVARGLVALQARVPEQLLQWGK